MSNFVEFDWDQAFLLLADLRDWVPEDDLAHFVIAAIEDVDAGLQTGLRALFRD